MYRPDSGDLIQWAISLYKWLLMILVGIVGKLSHDLSRRRRLTFYQWLGVIGVSAFVGYVVCVWCIGNGLEQQAAFIVPIATLLGEKIMIYVTDNFKNIATRVIDAIFRKK